MGEEVTEMLKGVLEGVVLAIRSGRPAYGYEITAWLLDQGFSDIAEGAVTCPAGPDANGRAMPHPHRSPAPRQACRRPPPCASTATADPA